MGFFNDLFKGRIGNIIKDAKRDVGEYVRGERPLIEGGGFLGKLINKGVDMHTGIQHGSEHPRYTHSQLVRGSAPKKKNAVSSSNLNVSRGTSSDEEFLDSNDSGGMMWIVVLLIVGWIFTKKRR